MKKGFTLIEILVVVAMIMVIMVSISGIMSGVFNSQNKNKASDLITQNGSWILNELKKNILNADSSGHNFNCANDYSNIQITSVKDGEISTIRCIEGNNIASESDRGAVNLVNNKELRLTGCGSFVTCSTMTSSQLSNVIFNFDLSSGAEGSLSETTKNFSIDLTLRN
jgi:hypothetical protein